MESFEKIISGMIGKKISIEFLNYKIDGLVDTIYETLYYDELKNDFDDGISYTACLVKIIKFVKLYSCDKEYEPNQFIEISKFNCPLKIYNEYGDLIWFSNDIFI